MKTYPTTPDGRYFVHQERLWRCSNPSLDENTKRYLVSELMAARRAVKSAKSKANPEDLAKARARVNHAKIALGERGPTWWNDDIDHNRQMVKNSPYARWWRGRKED